MTRDNLYLIKDVKTASVLQPESKFFEVFSERDQVVALLEPREAN